MKVFHRATLLGGKSVGRHTQAMEPVASDLTAIWLGIVCRFLLLLPLRAHRKFGFVFFYCRGFS